MREDVLCQGRAIAQHYSNVRITAVMLFVNVVTLWGPEKKKRLRFKHETFSFWIGPFITHYVEIPSPLSNYNQTFKMHAEM